MGVGARVDGFLELVKGKCLIAVDLSEESDEEISPAILNLKFQIFLYPRIPKRTSSTVDKTGSDGSGAVHLVRLALAIG